MQTLRQAKFALPSLVSSLLLCFITTIHHLHSSLVLHPDGPGMHVVWIEIVIIPATCLSMFYYLRKDSQRALLVYLFIAVLGFVFLGVFEGGWNHTGKLIAYLRIDSVSTQIGDILPRDNIHLWFYELTGVLTFICAMIASWYSWQFYRASRRLWDGSNVLVK